MRHLLISIYWWSLCICIGCSDQPQQIPSKHTSDAESTQAEHSSTTEKSAEKADGETERHLNRADREVIAWFDSLGFPDLTNRRLVRVSTGELIPSVEENGVLQTQPFPALRLASAATRGVKQSIPLQSQSIPAFLLSEEGEDFTVFTLDLFTRTFKKTSADAPKHEQVRFEVLNLEQEAAEQLKRLRKPKDSDDEWRRFSEMQTVRAEVFVLARGCAGNGLTQLAHHLIAHAASMPDRQTGEAVRVDGLAAVLSNEIEDSHMWRNDLALGQPSVSRLELLKRFRHFAEKFPNSQHTERAKATAKILEQMVREDEVHANKKLKPLEKMTTKEQVAELIYQLRDRNRGHFGYGLTVGFLYDDGDNPASQLVAIGAPALEQLIESVDDDRFTRRFEGYRVIRVGECCLEIMNRIHPTGRRFDIDGNPELAKRAMKAWYLGDRPKE